MLPTRDDVQLSSLGLLGRQLLRGQHLQQARLQQHVLVAGEGSLQPRIRLAEGLLLVIRRSTRGLWLQGSVSSSKGCATLHLPP